jgi:hypothetical protein
MPVDQEQLQLGTDGARAGPEAGAALQPGQGEQALVQPRLEPLVVDRVEPLPIDREPHGRPVTSALPARPAAT